MFFIFFYFLTNDVENIFFMKKMFILFLKIFAHVDIFLYISEVYFLVILFLLIIFL